MKEQKAEEIVDTEIPHPGYPEKKKYKKAPEGWQNPALDVCPECNGYVAASSRLPDDKDGNERGREKWCEARHHWRRNADGSPVMLDDDGNDIA